MHLEGRNVLIKTADAGFHLRNHGARLSAYSINLNGSPWHLLYPSNVFSKQPFHKMVLHTVYVIAAVCATLVKGTSPLLRGHQVREDLPTQCTSSTVETITTINRGNEGIWHVRANQTDLNQLYQSTRTDWLDNNKTAVLNECTRICLAGNSTDVQGVWLPSGKHFEGTFVNTPGGSSQHPVWMCACYDNTLSQANLAAGGGVVSENDICC